MCDDNYLLNKCIPDNDKSYADEQQQQQQRHHIFALE